MLPIENQTNLPGGTVHEGSFLYERGFGMGGHLWIPVLITLLLILFFGLLSYIFIKKQFNFGRRGIKSYKGIEKHLNYISQIKAANSLTELNFVINQINEERAKYLNPKPKKRIIIRNRIRKNKK